MKKLMSLGVLIIYIIPVFLFPNQIHKNEIFKITWYESGEKFKYNRLNLLSAREDLLKAKNVKKQEVEKVVKAEDKADKIEWINIIATAYTASADECGNSLGITASGTKVSINRGTIAAPHSIPFNTKIVIPELNKTFTVEDRGSKKHIKWINSNTMRIDVYMKNKKDAIKFGVKRVKGYILKD